MATTATTTPTVNLHTLTQSDLYNLSLTTNPSPQPPNTVTPKINRSLFNESTGSRKQTYSHLRLPSSSSLHRRKFHLRMSSLTVTPPEQAENTHIIQILKNLCKQDVNLTELGQDEEKNSEFEKLSYESLGIKRKRGRPRKHENVVFIRPPNAKRLRSGSVKEEVVFDGKIDKVIVNEKGEAVDLAKVGEMDEVFGGEIRRRTVGMGSEEELLVFLRELNGQWGSRRRKRRVVDVSEFGDVLPKGWKVSLSIKKKEGRVWLFCRRFISPSGRQFESCKDISAYLISIIGEENLDDQNHVNINSSVDFSVKEDSADADLLHQDIRKDNHVDDPSSSSSPSSPSPSPSPSSSPSPPPASAAPTNGEEQVSLDEMVIEGGDNLRNGHIGCHSEIEKAEPSLTPATKLSCDTDLVTEVLNKELLASVPAGDVVETNDVDSAKEPVSVSLNNDEIVHDLNIVSQSKQEEAQANIERNILLEEACRNEVYRTDQTPDGAVSQSELFDYHNQTPDGAVSQSELFGDEDSISINDSDREPETSSEIPVNCLGQDIFGTTTSLGVLDPAVSETGLIEKAIICEEKGFDGNLDMDIDTTPNELISEKEKVVGESSSGFFLDRFGLDKDAGTMVKELSTNLTIESVKDVNSISNDTYNNINKVSSGLESSKLDGQFDVETNAFGNYGESGIEGLSTFEEENEFQRRENKIFGNDLSFSAMMMQINSSVEEPSSKPEETKLDDFNIFRNNEAKRNESVASLGLSFNTKGNLEFCSLVPSENQQAFGFQDDVSCLYENTMDDCKEESSERGLLDHFSDDIFENKMYSASLDGLKFDEDRDMSSNELSLAFGKSHALYPDTAMRVEQKKECVGPSRINKAFDVHTNLSMVNNSMVDDLKTGGSPVGSLFNLSNNSKTSGFQSGSNTVYPGRAWEGLKSDEVRNSANKFTPGFRSNHGHGQAREEVNSGNKFASGFGSNHGHGQAREEVHLGNKFTSGFGSNHGHGQSREEVVPSGMWRSGGNQLQSGLPNTSHAHMPPPSSFHSFNIMPEKAGDGQFRLNERYNEGYSVSGLRSGRPEPVEFSFLTGRSQHNPHPHPLQGDPRVFSYNSETEQQFDSSFWLGRNTMMPNPAGRNQMTGVCAWCRNEFHLQQAHSGAQDGIGSLCPSCSASVSGHVNML